MSLKRITRLLNEKKSFLGRMKFGKKNVNSEVLEREMAFKNL